MKKKEAKKLSLNRETIVNLNVDQMKDLRAGEKPDAPPQETTDWTNYEQCSPTLNSCSIMYDCITDESYLCTRESWCAYPPEYRAN